MIAKFRDLQHRDGDKREESSVVKVDEGGSFVRGHFLVAREESGRGEDDPVNAEEDGTFLKDGRVGHRMFEAPVGKAHVRGKQAEEGQVRPAIANQEKRRGDGQSDVGGKDETYVATCGVVNRRHIRGVVRSGHGKHGHDFRLLFCGEPNDEDRPRREQLAGKDRGWDQAEDRGFYSVKCEG